MKPGSNSGSRLKGGIAAAESTPRRRARPARRHPVRAPTRAAMPDRKPGVPAIFERTVRVSGAVMAPAPASARSYPLRRYPVNRLRMLTPIAGTPGLHSLAEGMPCSTAAAASFETRQGRVRHGDMNRFPTTNTTNKVRSRWNPPARLRPPFYDDLDGCTSGQPPRSPTDDRTPMLRC